MRSQFVKQVLLLLFLGVSGVMSVDALAATISLVPDSNSVEPGDQVTVEIIGDFSGDDTLGGGIDLTFVSEDLELVSVVTNGVGIPAYNREPDVSTGTLSGMAFGDFNGIGVNSLVIGTLVFDIPFDSEGGVTEISISASAGVAGPFASALTFELQPVIFSGVSINIKGELLFEDGFENP
jgi:hypothetical protein